MRPIQTLQTHAHFEGRHVLTCLPPDHGPDAPQALCSKLGELNIKFIIDYIQHSPILLCCLHTMLLHCCTPRGGGEGRQQLRSTGGMMAQQQNQRFTVAEGRAAGWTLKVNVARQKRWM